MSNIAPFEHSFAHGIYKSKYAMGAEEWTDTAVRVTESVMGAINSTNEEKGRIGGLIQNRQFMPGGRYLYASGRDFHQVQNCLLLRAEDSREGWAELSYKAEMALMTGAGIGVVYSDLRGSGSVIKRTGGLASGPIAKMKSVNDLGRYVMQGGARRSAIWAGLHWWHPDIYDFIRVKDWPQWIREKKAEDFTFAAEMDMTNVSVILDTEFFEAYSDPSHLRHEKAHEVYRKVVDKMLTTAEPGFSVDAFENEGENLRNACTEVTSYDDSDICNLGSLSLPRFSTKEQFASAVKDATLFLIAGTVYSELPYAKVAEVREKNRRLGLGIMGIHEWLLQRDKPYGPDDELGEWLAEYERATEYAWDHADRLGLSRPVKTRAIAPTGTIGIVGETTTGIEPIMAAAYKRRLRNASHAGDTVEYEYVIDPTAKRLLDQGHSPEGIEDAYSLSYDVERRIEFQAWVQKFVDHGISSTINLPYVVKDEQEQRDFGDTLMKHLPHLRGVTCYPDGCRPGQPITPVPLDYAIGKTGVRYEETEERCVGGTCGV